MDEARARAICTSEGGGQFSLQDCREADKWVKGYALGKLVVYLRSDAVRDAVLADYVLTMVRHTYGTAETDEFLKELKCYPDWMQ